jgi:hypothetical protein
MIRMYLMNQKYQQLLMSLKFHLSLMYQMNLKYLNLLLLRYCRLGLQYHH